MLVNSIYVCAQTKSKKVLMNELSFFLIDWIRKRVGSIRGKFGLWIWKLPEKQNERADSFCDKNCRGLMFLQVTRVDLSAAHKTVRREIKSDYPAFIQRLPWCPKHLLTNQIISNVQQQRWVFFLWLRNRRNRRNRFSGFLSLKRSKCNLYWSLKGNKQVTLTQLME